MNQGTPHYPLDKVKQLVRDGKYTGVRRAVMQAEDLGYEGESKYKLLEELSESDFNHVFTPKEHPDFKMDVYIIKRRSLIRPEYINEIYIKFMICEKDDSNSIKVSELNLRSFHLQQ